MEKSMSFTPKFADLVRNIATVSGTGPVMLGPAVNGFTGLAEAVGIGGQFYYCLQNLDKPHEREVGRGTLQSNGRVGRDPVAGHPIDFSAGTKSIALVTAAEWFTRLDAAMITAADRAELAGIGEGRAYLAEGDRSGNFVFDPSDLSTLVGADPLEGIYIAPTSDRSGASGAWVRSGWRELNPGWFGAVADDETDCSPAFDAAFRVAEALAVAGAANPAIYRGGPAIAVGPGKYYCSSSWEPLATLRIQGAGGLGWGAATQLRFAAGVTGVRAQAHNTSGATTVDGVPHFAGDALVIMDIYFRGGFAGGAEAEAHGCHAKRAIHIERCTFDNFEGDGLYGHSSFGVGDATEGNSNVLRATNCVFTNCRSGVSAEHADANAWNLIACSYIGNRRWGREDRSFLGNQEFGSHYDSNGRSSWNSGASGRPASYVSHGGNRYFAIDGQESAASVNAPTGAATSNSWWGYWQAGDPSEESGIPAWFGDMAVRSGGPYLINGPSNASSVMAPHVEGNGVSQIDQLAMVVGGIPGHVKSVVDGVLANNRAKVLHAEYSGLQSAGNFTARGNFRASGETNLLGPSIGTAVIDGTTVLASRNNSHLLQAQLFDAGGNAGAIYGSLGFYSGLGTILDTTNPRIHRFRISGADIATIDVEGVKLTVGKALYSDGQKVVGARGASLPANASDLASAISLVNAIKARLKATGGHGLVDD